MAEAVPIALDSSGRKLVRLLFVAVGITLLGLAGFAWSVSVMRTEFRAIAYDELYLQKLTSSIVEQDKALALLVQLAVGTRDERWESQYDEIEPLLAGAVAAAAELAPEAYGGWSSAIAEQEVLARVALEHEALALSRAGRQADAQALLGSQEYQDHRTQHEAAVDGLIETVDARVTQRLGAFEARIVRTALLLCGIALVVLATWAGILRSVLRHMRERLHAMRELAAARDGLELRVQERTASLSAEMERRQELQVQLLEASRAAGKAEVATSVLHNVGNVLNSVNVSAELVATRIRSVPADDLTRASRLLAENLDTIDDYLHKDERGRHFPGFLASATERIATLRTSSLEEVTRMQSHLDHIKRVVSLQQDNARHKSVLERTAPQRLMEEAIGLCGAKLVDVRLVRDLPALDESEWARHDILQILVNLLKNAAEACASEPSRESLVTVKVSASRAHPGGACFEVGDNGVGIAKDQRTAIFAYGVTTKQEGHGFGLHSAATSAKALGGTLTAASDGPGKGAIFALDLPPGRSEPHTEGAAV